MDESTRARSDSSWRICSTSSVGHKASFSRNGRKAYTSASVGSRANTLSAMNDELMLPRTFRRQTPSGRWCSDKIRRMAGTLESPEPTVVALEFVNKRQQIIRGMVDRHDPGDECPRCETGHGSHSEKERVQETELRQAEFLLKPSTTTTTAPTTLPAST